MYVKGGCSEKKVEEIVKQWIRESTFHSRRTRYDIGTYFIKCNTNDKIFKIKNLLRKIGFNLVTDTYTLCLCTTRPGIFIGEHGCFVKKYRQIFKDQVEELGITNVEIILVRDSYIYEL